LNASRARVGALVLLAAVASVVSLAAAGCGGGKSEAGGVVRVSGSLECKMIEEHSRLAEQGAIYDQVYLCADSMSDERVSGTEEAKLQTRAIGENATAGAFYGPVTLTNKEGTWRGTCRGAAVFNDPSGENRNYGRCEYRGEGAFEGLRYVEMVAGSDQTFEVTGWIESAADSTS
jgi:hypothetical protein